MVAIDEVARLAGVSKSTVSRALSGATNVAEDTRQRVIAIADRLGYVPQTSASSLRSGQSRTVAVLVPFVNRWYCGAVIEGVHSSLNLAGYDLSLMRVPADAVQRQRTFSYFLRRTPVDAVIIVGLVLSDEERKSLLALDRPLLCLSESDPVIPSLIIDNRQVTALAARRLIDLGHRRIAYVGPRHPEQADIATYRARALGFRDELRAQACTEDLGYWTTDATIQDGYEAGLALLQRADSRPRALVAACDEIAIGVLIAAREFQVAVPTELSIVGVDDHELAKMFRLTTMRQDPQKQGELAVETIVKQINAASPVEGGTQTTIPVELIERGSATVAPAHPARS